jgi:hypothetical protein
MNIVHSDEEYLYVLSTKTTSLGTIVQIEVHCCHEQHRCPMFHAFILESVDWEQPNLDFNFFAEIIGLEPDFLAKTIQQKLGLAELATAA